MAEEEPHGLGTLVSNVALLAAKLNEVHETTHVVSAQVSSVYQSGAIWKALATRMIAIKGLKLILPIPEKPGKPFCTISDVELNNPFYDELYIETFETKKAKYSAVLIGNPTIALFKFSLGMGLIKNMGFDNVHEAVRCNYGTPDTKRIILDTSGAAYKCSQELLLRLILCPDIPIKVKVASMLSHSSLMWRRICMARNLRSSLMSLASA